MCSPGTPCSRAFPVRLAALLLAGDDRAVDPRAATQLPDDTVVHTGHGLDTTIGAEKKAAQGDWLWSEPSSIRTTLERRVPRGVA